MRQKKLYLLMEQWGLPLPDVSGPPVGHSRKYAPVTEDEAREVLRRVYEKQGRIRATGRGSDLETSLQELRHLREARATDSESF